MGDREASSSTDKCDKRKKEGSSRKKRSHSPGSDEPSSTSNAGEERKEREEKSPESSEAEKVEVPDVHSANAWEKADMDQSRKAKFLRLMGAGKKQHTGRFVIGDKQGETSPTKTETSDSEQLRSHTTKDLEANLESEYKQRMGDHLKHRDKRHRGLGYHGESTSSLDEGASQNFQPAQTIEEDREAVPAHDVTEDGHVHFVSEDGDKRVDL